MSSSDPRSNETVGAAIAGGCALLAVVAWLVLPSHESRGSEELTGS